MTGDRRALVAAACLAVLSLVLWNVIYDRGVHHAADRYLLEREAYLQGQGPQVELAPAMRAGVRASAWHASLVTAPGAVLAAGLVVISRRGARRV